MRQWHRAIATTGILFALGDMVFGQDGSVGKQGDKDPCSGYAMRVVTPSESSLYKMPVVKPDESIDYKMQVIHPCPSPTVVLVPSPQLVKPDAEKKGNALSPRLKFTLPSNGKQKTPAESLTDSLLNASPKIKPE